MQQTYSNRTTIDQVNFSPINSFRVIPANALVSLILFLIFQNNIFAATKGSEKSFTETANLESIMRLAETQRTVPVIIKLKMDTQPEGDLSVAGALDQQQLINSSQKAVLSKLSQYKPKDVKQFNHLPFTAMALTADGLKAVMKNPDVAGVYEDKLSHPTLAQSNLLTGATSAVSSGFSGQGQVVAILDTGVDKTHPFLANKVVHEACFSRTIGSQGSTSICPNGSGVQVGTGAGVPCSDTIHGCRHGTHVAGIAAGKGASFSGVAKDANIMAIQVFSRFSGSENCGNSSPCALAYTSDQILALEHVYSQRGSFNIAAVNMSLGGGSFSSSCDGDPRKSAIDLLRSAGIATIVSSGNEGLTDSMGAPACISSAISVGSTTKSDTVSSFSNSASFLDLLAPGSSINSSIPGGGFSPFSGTSMAAPQVTGAFAILKSSLPSASVTQIENTLKATGIGITDTRNGISKPRIKIDSALNVLDPPAIPTLFVSPTNGFTIVGPPGGPFTPVTRSFTLSNITSSGQNLNYAITINASWLSVSSTNSVIAAGDSAPITVSINSANANNLPLGEHTGSITFTNTTNNAGNLTIPVSLIVSGNNDFFNNAIPIGSSGQPEGTVSDENVSASHEDGEPNHVKKNGNKSVWWKWTAPANGDISIETCGSDFDTVLAVYSGTHVGALSEITSNDDQCDLQSQVSFSARSGITYYIVVDGFNSAAGNIALSWDFTQDSSTPVPSIAVLPATDVTFTGANPGPFSPSTKSYSITHVGSTNSQTVSISTPSWLTASTQSFTLISGATESVSFSVNPNAAALPAGIYSGIIDFGFTARAVILDLSSGTLSNDHFQSAASITGQTKSITWNSNNASKESNEPNHAGNSGGKSVWWKWTATKSGLLTIDTEGTTFDTVLAVYTGNQVSQLTENASDDDSGTALLSSLTLPTTAGTTYFIAVDGYNGDSGSLQLNLFQNDNRNDFDGDGKSDILWRHAISGNNMLYFMNGNTTISNAIINTEADLQWEIKSTGDFNGDGKADILWRHANTGDNWMYLMNGSGIIANTKINTEADLNWKIAGTGDFNGDGKDDIFWRNTSTGDNWVYLMDGATIATNSKINTVDDLDWKVVGIGDFNGDGKDDILWRHSNNGRIWLYQMDGITIASSDHIAFTGLDWDIKTTGDFDGDGMEDILWRNDNNGRVWTYLMNGSTIATSRHVAFTGFDWDIQTTGDYNGDGKSDIFWRNNVTGLNWMYLMNGTNITTNINAGSLTDLNWKVIR